MIERAELGRTGHHSSRVIFGAAALSRMDQDEADELLPLLLEHGVNHIDTAAAYGDSELRIGPWMAEHRRHFFLATKTGDRTGPAARASLERSLERLQVDHVDLIQLHNLVEEDDWRTAHGPGGALAALAQARDEGLVRAIGVTGHGFRIAGMHLRSLGEFDYDTVLLPYSWILLRDGAYRRDVDALLARCAERRVAVQTIKSVARRRWADQDGAHRSWYEPLGDTGAIARSVRWVLANPQVFLNTSSDARLLRPILEAASAGAGQPAPGDEELEADAAAQGMHPIFDHGDLERI